MGSKGVMQVRKKDKVRIGERQIQIGGEEEREGTCQESLPARCLIEKMFYLPQSDHRYPQRECAALMARKLVAHSYPR